ncbi:hypothetical protein HZC32_03180, partial [Candidatus Woesearchaeota archaeon]|nr:hypothetical protein [Candidatus Woesearchaeota archaeon]
MSCKLYDWRGREISSTLEERLFSNEESSKERIKFYQSYFKQIGKSLGFKEFSGDMFGRIAKEFRQQHLLGGIFSSYAEFFHAFFIYPYGFSYHYDDSKHVFNDEISSITDDKERKIAGFVRGMNLPLLFYLALESYPQKKRELSAYQEQLQKEKVLISYSMGTFQRKLGGTLKPEFNTNFWNNLFSDFEDCLFIHYDQKEQKVTFQDYWFASLLHQLHPKIYYLNFVAGEDKESTKLKKAYSRPLVRVILMETDSSAMPLIVEGVL